MEFQNTISTLNEKPSYLLYFYIYLILLKENVPSHFMSILCRAGSRHSLPESPVFKLRSRGQKSTICISFEEVFNCSKQASISKLLLFNKKDFVSKYFYCNNPHFWNVKLASLPIIRETFNYQDLQYAVWIKLLK